VGSRKYLHENPRRVAPEEIGCAKAILYLSGKRAQDLVFSQVIELVVVALKSIEAGHAD